MSTRKIKDAKDLATSEKIYFRGHAKATYMSDGSTVEDAIKNIKIPEIDVDNLATKSFVTSQGYIKEHQDISGKVDKSSLSAVATSGSYNDLNDKPTIPNAVTESTVDGWGFTKNAGTITEIKMNGSSKGASGVVDLGTVITSHQDISGKQDKLTSGTNIKTINGVSILGSGNISTEETSIGKAEVYGIFDLSV